MTVFFDSNILLYAEDDSAPAKRDVAQALLREALRTGTGVLSTQVLQEYFVNATRKLGVSPALAQERTRLYRRMDVVIVRPELIDAAIDLHRLEPVSFWDALILRAAADARCSVLYTEDLQHGRVFDGVRVVDPFRTKGGPELNG